MTTSRFELEQEIMNCWSVVEDVKALYDSNEAMDEDTLNNYLLGLTTIYQVKFSKLWNTFEQCIAEKII